MAKIYAPNKQYMGISASVAFAKGVGETADPVLIKWFKEHGYKVEEDEEAERIGEDKVDNGSSEFDNMTIEELQAYAEANSIDIGNATSQKGILKKILEAKKDAK